MTFDNPTEVDQVCEQMREAEDARSEDRARIDRLFNGSPPFTDAEAEKNNSSVNVNFLTTTRLGHDVRSQIMRNFTGTGQYFSAKTDWGKAHKRATYSSIVTREIGKRMKDSLEYFEYLRSKIAMEVLHGIGTGTWEKDRWCPDPCAVGDILIPADTLLTFRNLPFFALRRSYTGHQLLKILKSEKRDKGWNAPLVKESLKWIDREAQQLFGSTQTNWNAERQEERFKGSGACYASDAVPTIDVFDFLYWSDEKNEEGWRRRMVLDRGEGSGAEFPGKGEWLYNSGSRVFARKRENIFTTQFADLSAVAPFKYHSVRGPGFLLFAICHLENRMLCRFNESVFETMMMYFRVASEDDAQKALKLNLINRGFIDRSLEFIPQNERFQVRADLVQLGLATNQRRIEDNIASYRATTDLSPEGIEKTKFQVMAELGSQTQLISAAIAQAYQYQIFEYRETFRRFLNPKSTDPDVLSFRASCLKKGVPGALLSTPEAWDIEAERVIGGGNKTMEMAIANQFMQIRNAFDPEPQRKILRNVALAMTDDPSLAMDLVPDQPEISNSIHDAQLAFGALFTGAPVAIKSGINRQEYIEALLVSMASIIQRIEQTGSMATMQEAIGLQNVGAHIQQNIDLLSQDEEMAEQAKALGDQLGQMLNMVKAYWQRLQEQQGQQNGNGEDAKLQVELQKQLILAEAKKENLREARAQKTALTQIEFEAKEARKDQEMAFDLQRQEAQAQLDGRLRIMQAQIDALTKPKPQKKAKSE